MENGYEGKLPYEKADSKAVPAWRPPCSCGVYLKDAVYSAEVHLWRPPCSCGVSLKEAI